MPHHSKRWLIASGVITSVICGTVAVSVGQGRIVFNGGQLQLDGTSGPVDPQQGVYVRDSAIAADKFELGKRMERLKEWPKSADVYQEILEKYQDRVVPTVTNEKGQAIKYASVTVAVQERLARWPEEGLTVYKARFEPAAATLLEQARRDDLGALHRIFSLYFATDTAKTAGTRLIDLYLEQGEFSAAAWIGDRLLEWHPGIGADRPSILFRTALAYHLAGNEPLAEKRAQELKTNFPDDIGNIAGKDMKYVQAVEQQLESKAPVAAGVGGDSYRMINGDVARAAISTAQAKPGARVWSIALSGPPLTGQPEATKAGIMAQFENAQKLGLTMGIIPAVDRGEMFFHDGYRMYGLHVESGVPLAGWNQTYSGQRNGQYWLPGQSINNLAFNLNDGGVTNVQLMAPRQHTVALTDDAVLAVMGQPDMRALLGQAAAADGGTRLVCLERVSGKLRWSANPNDLPNNPGNARNLSFSGSPLVVGDQVFVIARGSSGAGVEDCHLFCYELASGKYKWSCYVASSQVANMMNMPQPAMLSNDTLSHAAFASGRVFINTNLGAVAAIDAYSGATAWLTIYPRDEANNLARQRGMMLGGGGWGWGGAIPPNPNGDNVRPWEFNPVIVQDGKLFVLPNDGRYLHIFDAGTGEELKRINREIEFNGDTAKINMLLAVIGERLIIGSSEKLFCIKWNTYKTKPGDEHRLDLAATEWLQPFDSIRGRPFVTRDSVVVASEKALSIVNLDKGKVVQRFPREGGEWPDGEGPGNIVVTADQVIVAAAKAVSIYADLAGIRQKYENAIAADPNNVEARLVYAEQMFNARELKETRKALDDAIGVLGGLNNMRPGPFRDRAFSDSLMFAQKLGADKNDNSIVLANELFDRAAASASNPSQKVNYRLSRARFIESLKEVQNRPDYPRAVRLYQEILSDPEMRIITLAGEDASGTMQAGKLAESAINDLVRKVDRSIYDELEKEAAAKLAALGASGNPDELMALAENYPNSTVASKALMDAARMYEQTGKPRMATQVLRRLNWKYNSRFAGAEKAELIEAMARNYLKVGNNGAALGRLQKGASVIPDEKLREKLVMADGKPLAGPNGNIPQTVAQAADILQQIVQKRAAGAVPDAKVPPPPSRDDIEARRPIKKPFQEPPIVVANIQAIIEPPVELIDRIRTDRLMTWSEKKLACFAPGGVGALWTSDAISDQAMGLAWLDKQLLTWGESEVALIDGESGKTAWKVDLRSLPAIELIVTAGVSDGPSPAPAVTPPPAPVGAQDILVQQRMAQELAIRRRLVVRPGMVINDPPPDPAAGGAGGMGGAEAANNGAADGVERVLHVRPLTDRIIVSTTTGRVLAINLENGRLIWQTRLASGRQIQQTLATDDFTAARLAEGQNVQLVVLDTFNGQQIWRKPFVTSQQNWPMNCALSPDGMLVWTTPVSMAAQDLYEPAGDRPTWDRTNQRRSYVGMTLPDQLVVNGLEILAVVDQGKFIERRSLRTGHEPYPVLSTGALVNAVDNVVRLRLSGPRLYILGNKSMVPFSLEHGIATPSITIVTDVNYLAAEAMLTSDYVFVPGILTSAPAGGSYCLLGYSRTLVPAEGGKFADSGRLVYKRDYVEPSKIKSWSAVDGGIYYLTGDERLVFLKGTK